MATTTLPRPAAAPADDFRAAATEVFGAVFEAVLTAHGDLAVLTRNYLQELLRLRLTKTDSEYLLLVRSIHVLNVRLAADELLAHPERRADVGVAAERFARKAQRGFDQPLTLGDVLPPAA